MYRVLIWAFAICIAIPLAASAREMKIRDADIVQQTTPAVVNIAVWKIRPPANGDAMPGRIRAYGSGFVIDPSGIIVTNKHVIDDAISITAIFSNGNRLHARLVAAASMMDVAVLKVDADHPLPALKWGNSDAVRVGDAVLTIGNPLGIGMSVAAGIVSAMNRDLLDSPFDDYIQTDAALNHGNSGGPLIDRHGEVIGIDTALYNTDPKGGFIGIGFAIAADRASQVVRLLLDPNHPQLGWLGITLNDVTPELAEALDVPGGFIISALDPAGPALRAGLRIGDVLSRVGDDTPLDARAFLWAIATSRLGQKVALTIWREGKQVSVTPTVEAWPNDVLGGGLVGGNLAQAVIQKAPDPGIRLQPLTDEARKQYGLDPALNGVLVSAVERDCEASDLGVVPGDVIIVVQGLPVTSPADVRRAVVRAQEQHRAFIALLLRGKSGTRWISLSVSSGGT